jgi:hypothetical protein
MYCYRFTDKAAFRALAAVQGLLTEDTAIAGGGIYDPETGETIGPPINEPFIPSHTYAIDEIGVIYEGGTYDAEGAVITPPTPLPGWHVNTTGIAPKAWDEFLVTPEQPVRVWA